MCAGFTPSALPLAVRVLGKLFRRLFLTRLTALYDVGRLAFHGSLAHLADRQAFLRHLVLVRKKRWVVYAKPPFSRPGTVLPYDALAREAGSLRAATASAGLSLGDRFCLALAKRLGVAAYTADKAWCDVAAKVETKVVCIR